MVPVTVSLCYSSAMSSSRDAGRRSPADRSVADLAARSPVVLDSWHLREGRAIGIDRHRERFCAGVRAVFGVGEEESAAAYDDALPQLPADGSWFPAFVWTAGGLRCLVRPFPVERLRTRTTLRLGSTIDARKRPVVKGFDYHWQLATRASAVDAGYDDELLIRSDGTVSEAAFSTLVLWRDDRLVVPRGPRLDSVTLAVLRDTSGLGVREAPVTAADLLAARTAFTLSALHGVRLVERVNATTYQGDSHLQARLQAVLEGQRRPVIGPPPEGTWPPCASC